MCKVLAVSRSGYYYWIKRKPSDQQIQRERLSKEIKQMYQGSKGRYGSPKITNELRDKGWKVSRPRVARIMRSEGLKSIICKKFRGATTDSTHNFPVAENHLNREFFAQAPGQKWVSDITYISTRQGWMYLTIILDLYDRKIIGWSLSTTLITQDTILAAWRMAIINRPIQQPLIFHSDQGIQYASYLFTNELNKYNVIQSMSRKGNCWDNAVAENFFKILKSELVKHSVFYSILQAKTVLFEFIEIWYNRKRKHAYLGYKTPEQYGKINYSKCA
jgi:transposase InsO family protein